MKTKIQLIVCSVCGNGLFARCEHDERTCSCEATSIKMTSSGLLTSSEEGHATFDLEILKSPDDLRVDFEEMNDRFGLVPNGVKFYACMTAKVKAVIPTRRHFEDDLANLPFLWSR